MTLHAENITVSLSGRDIVRDLSLRLNPGEMTAILGPNGSGKSTLIRTLAGLLKPSRGKVSLDNQDIRSLPPRSLAKTLALVAQSATCAPSTTVLQHVALGRHPHRVWWKSLLASAADDQHHIEHALEVCGVAHLRHRTVETLSGGERQRVRLATAIAQQPEILLLDEPLTGLDVEHQLECLELLREMNIALGMTVVVVLHDLDHALRTFSRAVIIESGRITADGPPADALCPRVFADTFRVDGCASCDVVRKVPVVVCRSLRARAAANPAPSPAMPLPIKEFHVHPHAANTPSAAASCPHASAHGANAAHAHHHHHHGADTTAGAGCPAGLAMMLRTGTQDLHDKAENHDFQRAFAAGQISRAQYALFLVQMLHVHAALDPNLRSLQKSHPLFTDLVSESHLRHSIILQDLADLGVKHESCVVHPPTRRFADFINKTAQEDPVSLVGILYVKEGATNGNKIIVKAIRQSLGLAETEASRYLDPHGAEQRKRWMAFKGMLDTLALSAEEKTRVVAAARKTFELFADLSSELAALEPAQPVAVESAVRPGNRAPALS